MNKQRLFWVDGLRGMACIIIFVHHFCIALFPATHYGPNAITHGSNEWDLYLSQSPFGALINGNFWVCVFCLVSGLVLGYKIFQADTLENLHKDMFKRYFRLALPVFFVSLVVYILLRLNLFDNIEVNQIIQSPWIGAGYNEKVPLKSVLISSFISVWFSGNATFSNAFWMLQYIFCGSYLTYIVSMITRGKSKRIYIVFGSLIFVFAFLNSYLIAFVIGDLLAYNMVYHKHPSLNWFGVMEMFAGFFMGGFPTEIEPTGIYSVIPHSQWFLMHILGATCVVIGIYHCSVAINILSRKILVKLGDISFAIYLVHIPLIYALSTKIFKICYLTWGRYQLSALATFIVTLFILIILAIIFHNYIERLCERVTKRIVDWFMVDSKVGMLNLDLDTVEKEEYNAE